MKTKQAFPICALSTLLFSACIFNNTQSDKENPSEQTEIDSTEESRADTPASTVIAYTLKDSVGPTFHTEEGDKRPSLHVEINLDTKGTSTEAKPEFEKTLSQLLTGKDNPSLEDAVKQYGDSIGQSFISSLEELYSDPKIKMNFPYEYFYEAKGNFTESTHPNTFSYQLKISSFTGGAHGGYCEIWHNFDRKTGKAILSKDAFDLQQEESIKTAIRNKICADRECGSVEELQDSLGLLVMGDVYISDNNFLLQNKGVQFLYNPYDIGPWAAGKIEVFLPYEDLKGMCTFTSKKKK